RRSALTRGKLLERVGNAGGSGTFGAECERGLHQQRGHVAPPLGQRLGMLMNPGRERLVVCLRGDGRCVAGEKRPVAADRPDVLRLGVGAWVLTLLAEVAGEHEHTVRALGPFGRTRVRDLAVYEPLAAAAARQ